MNTTVRESTQAEQFIAPAASVREEDGGYMLEVEMPGVNKEGLEISTEGNELTVTGRRSMPTIDGTLIHQESRRETFQRSFEIDPSIDVQKIQARIEQGLLTVTLPKADHVKPRRITVS